jgi:hypothetical protein
MFVCPIPGADAVTIAWHAGLHYGLAAVILVAGVVFLGLGVRAYRLSGPLAGSTRER